MLVAKKLAIALAVLMLAIVAWGLFLESNAVTIVINGQQVTGPLKGVIPGGGTGRGVDRSFLCSNPLGVCLCGNWRHRVGVLCLGRYDSGSACISFLAALGHSLGYPLGVRRHHAKDEHIMIEMSSN
jgi:hypothetical protein